MSKMYRFYPISRFAPEAGIELGTILLDQTEAWEGLTIDLTHCKAELLISSFIASFMQFCDEKEVLERVSGLDWVTDYQFQEDNIRKFIGAYKPSHSRLGPFQKQYKVDDHIDFDVGGVKGSGLVLGCSVRGIVDFYIILLDAPVPGYTDKAVVVPSVVMSRR